jgi:hypothetical protein
MIGRKLFTGPRQHELLSRLIRHVSKESQDNLLQVLLLMAHNMFNGYLSLFYRFFNHLEE